MIMKIKALVLMLLAVVFASGCSLSPVAPAGNEVLQEGLTNLYYEATSAKFDLALKGDITAPEGQVPAKINFDVTLSGDMDNSKPAEPKFNISLGGSGQWDDIEEQKVGVELKSDSSTLYFSLKELSDFAGQVPAEMVSEYVGKWFKMPIPAGTFDSLDVKSEMSEEEVKIKEIAQKTNFIKDIKYEGTKKIMGTEAYVYSGTLDKEAMKNFAIEVSKLDPSIAITESDIKDMDEQLKLFDLSGKFYVGVEDKILRGAEGVITATPEGGSVKVDFKLEMGNINESISIDAPADAQEFDPSMLLGGAAMMDSSEGMYDEYDPTEGMDLGDYDYTLEQ